MFKRDDRANAGEFPVQLVIMVSVDVAARIEAEAVVPGTGSRRLGGKSAVAREYLDIGMRRKDALNRAKQPRHTTDHIEFQAPAPPKLDGPVD